MEKARRRRRMGLRNEASAGSGNPKPTQQHLPSSPANGEMGSQQQKDQWRSFSFSAQSDDLSSVHEIRQISFPLNLEVKP
jgi:hypothetical protein